jgi:hypothetical protein
VTLKVTFDIHRKIESTAVLLLMFVGGGAVGWMLAAIRHRRVGALGGRDTLPEALGEGPLLPEHADAISQCQVSECRNDP